TARLVPALLHSREPRDTKGALEILTFVEKPLPDLVVTHLGHPDARARALACEHLGASGATAHAAAVCALFADEDLAVRASAIRAYGRLAPSDEAVLEPLLADESAEIRAAAASAL